MSWVQFSAGRLASKLKTVDDELEPDVYLLRNPMHPLSKVRVTPLLRLTATSYNNPVQSISVELIYSLSNMHLCYRFIPLSYIPPSFSSNSSQRNTLDL